MVEVSPHGQEDRHRPLAGGSGVEEIFDKASPLCLIAAEGKDFLELIDDQQQSLLPSLLPPLPPPLGSTSSPPLGGTEGGLRGSKGRGEADGQMEGPPIGGQVVE